MMTKELFEKLKKYETIFRTAIDAKYIRAMDSRFAADFVEACHLQAVYINTSCPACVLKAAQTLGRMYFEFKETEEQIRQIEPELPFDNVETDKSEESELPDYLPPVTPDKLDNNLINKEKKVKQSASKNKKKTK